MSLGSYRDLQVWQKAVDLTILIYQMTRTFPIDETYGLRSQVRRATTSIALNIAEGHGRSSTGDYLRLLSIARGSLAETETLVVISGRLGLLNRREVTEVMAQTEEISKMLRGLQNALKRFPEQKPAKLSR